MNLKHRYKDHTQLNTTDCKFESNELTNQVVTSNLIDNSQFITQLNNQQISTIITGSSESH